MSDADKIGGVRTQIRPKQKDCDFRCQQLTRRLFRYLCKALSLSFVLESAQKHICWGSQAVLEMMTAVSGDVDWGRVCIKTLLQLVKFAVP